MLQVKFKLIKCLLEAWGGSDYQSLFRLLQNDFVSLPVASYAEIKIIYIFSYSLSALHLHPVNRWSRQVGTHHIVVL